MYNGHVEKLGAYSTGVWRIIIIAELDAARFIPVFNKSTLYEFDTAQKANLYFGLMSHMKIDLTWH